MNEFSHYFKEVPSKTIDVYRVLHAFGVDDPCLQHAIKKLLVAGGRGAKDRDKDIAEAAASLERYRGMRKEEAEHEARRFAAVSAQPTRVDSGSPPTPRTKVERGGELERPETRTCCGNYHNPVRTVCIDCPEGPTGG